jgi:hypothetical protein
MITAKTTRKDRHECRSSLVLLPALFLVVLILSGSAIAQPNSQQSLAAAQQPAPSAVAGAGREQIADRWWEKVPSMLRISLRASRNRPALPIQDEAKLSAFLDEMREKGIASLEIFAPYYGGRSYGGLDSIDRYRLHPDVGTMEDFRRLVRIAHSKAMPIISFDNLGYCSVEAPEFLQACDDVKAGKETKWTKRFFWSDRADAPPPAAGDEYFMIRPTHLADYESSKHEFWEYSERAGKYYWTKWGGVDSQRNRVRLPQYNWTTQEMEQEAERVVRHWMDTGIDGMVIDAVNWYVGYTWQKGLRRITEVIQSYGNTFAQPEGAGGFHEDPVAWITEGGWNSVQEYGLGIWWEDDHRLVEAVEKGDPRRLEPALRAYHDRVVAAGGVLYYSPDLLPRFDEPAKQHLVVAAAAAFGDLVAYEYGRGLELDGETAWIFKTKGKHPALQQLSRRRHLPTNADDKYYAFLRTAPDESERVLVVLNFQPTAQDVGVRLDGVRATKIVDLRDGAPIPWATEVRVPMPAYGYRFFRVDAR